MVGTPLVMSALVRQSAALFSLKRNELFAGVGDDDLREVLRRSRESRVRAGGYLHVQADGGLLCVLVTGSLKLTRPSSDGREIVLDILIAPDTFGELSRSDDEPVDLFAEALEDSQVCTVAWEQFRRLSRNQPGLVVELARLMDQRRRRAELRLENQHFRTVAARLAHLLLQLSRRHGLPREDGTLLPLRLRQEDMANVIGASREFVSTTLGNFRRRSWIRFDQRRVVILDWSALSALLDG